MSTPGTGAAAWSGPALLVPVTVDALVLSQLSYNEGWSWITPNYRNALRFASQVLLFQNDPPLLIDPAGAQGAFTGVVLRWALPDGLTYAGQADGATGALTFPHIPNRWLVRRRVPGAEAYTAAWMLVSDYVGDPGGSAYLSGSQPVTLGKCYPLAQWPGEAGLAAGLDPPLTAVGLGDPAFAAYLPNLQHILAFHDDLAGVPASQVSYTVCGWYVGAAADPLSGWPDSGGWGAITGQLGWSPGDDADQAAATAAAQAWATVHGYAFDPSSARMELPARTVCHGLVCGVNWLGPAGAAQPGAPVVVAGVPSTTPALTVAHTAADAVATTVAQATAASGTSGTTAAAVAEALTALLRGQLPLLDAPDAGAQLAARLQDSWFQQRPGGTRWQLPAGASPPSPTQETQLDAVNAAQQQVDALTRQVASLQWDIYALWWKLSYVTANPAAPASTPTVITAALSAKQAAASTALAGLQAAAASLASATAVMDAQLSPLELQPVPEPPFLRPNDPVVLVQGAGRSYAHGEDGRFSEDGGLFCRFTGQTLASLTISGTSVQATAQSPQLTVALAAVTGPDVPAEVADLVTEAFFLDPANAPAIAALAGAAAPTADQVNAVAAQQTLMWNTAADPTLDQQTLAEAAGLGSAFGPVTVPSKVAVEYWAQPWSPLYLDWSVTYYPVGYPASPPGGGWTFPAAAAGTPLGAQTAAWSGTQPPAPGGSVQGRTVLTPQAADMLAGRLAQLVAQADNDSAEQPYLADINDAIAYLGTASVLSQALSGFTDLLLQRDPALVQQPDLATLGQWLTPPGGPAFTAAAAPSPLSAVALSPVRSGFLHLDKLWVVDDFGQRFDVLSSLQGDPQAGPAQSGPDLTPAPQPGWLALRPRLSQPSRLRLRFTDAVDDTQVVGLASAANPVCGWLIPSRVDDSLLVYDADGVLEGEVLLAQGQAQWLPAPDLGPPGAQTAPPDLANPHLAALVASLLTGASALSDLMITIENASWAIAPSGPDAGLLATLAGFPVAVARAQLLLELEGDPATSQRWADTGAASDGGIGQLAFPVALGSADLDDDGLVGFLPDGSPGQLSSPYGPSPHGYVTRTPASVTAEQPARLTLLLHPQGSVHAFSGLLPPVTAALPSQFQLAPVRATEMTFRSGPLLTPPDAIQLPLPAFSHGSWAWLEYDESDNPAMPRPLSRADTTARLPDAAPVLRDGWLRLSLGSEPTQLSYAVTPAALPADAGGPTGATLTVTAYNATSAAVTCDSITVTLPVGTGQDALTARPDLIQAVSAQPDDWLFQAGGPGQPGTFTATPAAAGTTVAPGAVLTFTLAGLTVSPDPGLSPVQVTEATAQGMAAVTLPVERYVPRPTTLSGPP